MNDSLLIRTSMDELLRLMELVRVDHRIGATHVSLYVALLCLKWKMGVEGVFAVGRLYCFGQ